jgi:hypothetical protein
MRSMRIAQGDGLVMAKTDSVASKAPRGAKPVMQAFIAKLDSFPDLTRAAIARSAIAMVQSELKLRREKVKIAAVKDKERASKLAAKSSKSAPTRKAEVPKALAKSVKPARIAKAAIVIEPEMALKAVKRGKSSASAPAPVPSPTPVARKVKTAKVTTLKAAKSAKSVPKKRAVPVAAPEPLEETDLVPVA